MLYIFSVSLLMKLASFQLPYPLAPGLSMQLLSTLSLPSLLPPSLLQNGLFPCSLLRLSSLGPVLSKT